VSQIATNYTEARRNNIRIWKVPSSSLGPDPPTVTDI
jgi:hypothetical protein